MAVPVTGLSSLIENLRTGLAWLFPQPKVLAMILPKLEIERAIESRNFWLHTANMVPVGVYALLAMEEGESDFNPAAIGDHHQAYSVFQWHWTPRGEAILANTKIDVRNCDHIHALKAAYWELRHTEHTSWDLLMKAKTIDEAVQIGVRHFERPGNPNSDIIKRTKYAYYWHDYFEPSKRVSHADR